MCCCPSCLSSSLRRGPSCGAMATATLPVAAEATTAQNITKARRNKRGPSATGELATGEWKDVLKKEVWPSD